MREGLPHFGDEPLRRRAPQRSQAEHGPLRLRAERVGSTSKGPGVTAHGLRHEALIEEYIAITGQEPPPVGGGEGLTREQEDAVRLAVSRLAGHNMGRASAAYLGAVMHRKKGRAQGGAGGGAAGGELAA
jgi:hypothetical protein